jgi:hypothetical protein
MNKMRSRLLLIAAIPVGGFVACNETVGECWYYGEGSENTSAGPGGGVIVPTGPAGVGGYGEAPPKEPQQDRDRPPPVCNEEEEEDETELGELVCKQENWGATCSLACKASDVFCAAWMVHTVTKELGKLYKCCNCKGDKRCWYTYDNGTKCVYKPETGTTLCGV